MVGFILKDTQLALSTHRKLKFKTIRWFRCRKLIACRALPSTAYDLIPTTATKYQNGFRITF